MASECVNRVDPVVEARSTVYARWAGQVAMNVLGLVIFALGVALTLRSGLGLGPWDVLHQGISRRTPLSFGQASQLVGAVVIGVGLALRVRPGIGTVLNMLLIGFFVDRFLGSAALTAATSWNPLARLALDTSGVLVVGLGSGLYIRANLGAGPRDGLMLGLHRMTGLRIAVARTSLELCVAVSGYALGGTVGIGTLIFAIGIGPAVELGFRIFGVPRRSEGNATL